MLQVTDITAQARALYIQDILRQLNDNSLSVQLLHDLPESIQFLRGCFFVKNDTQGLIVCHGRKFTYVYDILRDNYTQLNLLKDYGYDFETSCKCDCTITNCWSRDHWTFANSDKVMLHCSLNIINNSR